MNIENIKETKIAFFRRTGAYGAGNAEVMEKIKALAAARGLLSKAVILGIARDNPEATPPEVCRYDACLVTEKNFPENGEILYGTLPGGKYAVFTVRHTAGAVAAAWETVFSDCAAAGLTPDFSRPVAERYSAEMLRAGNCELCVPVKPADGAARLTVS